MGDFTWPPKRAVIQHRHRRHRRNTFRAPNQRRSAHDLGQQHGRFGVLYVQPHGERRSTDQPHLRQHQPHPDGRHTGEHRSADHGGWNRDLVVHRPVPPRRTDVQHLDGPDQRDPDSPVGHGRHLHRHGHELGRLRLHDVQHGRVGHTAEFPVVFTQRHRADHRSNDDAQRPIGVGRRHHGMVDQRRWNRGSQLRAEQRNDLGDTRRIDQRDPDLHGLGQQLRRLHGDQHHGDRGGRGSGGVHLLAAKHHPNAR